MGKFTKISQDAFETLQFDAGMILKNFNPSSAAAPTDSQIVTATTGGIKVDCVPSFVDLGEDVDNCPNNMMELKQLDQWEAKLGFTALNITAETIKVALSAADVADGKVTPRNNLETSDFTSIWWVGDITGGGWAAVELKNALSTGGFSLQTTKKGKGQLSVELTGHYSINAQNEVPMAFYIGE